MTNRQGLFLLIAIIGSFVLAVLIGIFAEGANYIVGGLLLVGGVSAIAFSRPLAAAQIGLSKKPFIPSHWKDVRPFTFLLWGTGLALLGLLHLFAF